ncbi:MAG: tetratricopeptide repeat protein, partial [Kiloniellales bacterium]|nr:tetratricopeptide repeat protein [Kiloniellales bacterium]
MIDRDDARRHFERGLACLQAGDRDGAEAAFKKTLDIDPDHPDALFGSGLCLEAQGKLHEAESAYRHAAMARIDFPQALTNLASLMTRTNRPAEAVQTLDRVLARRSDFEAARFNRGVAYYALRRLAEAEADFRHLLERRPDQADALNELGRVLLKQSRLREAAELFREGQGRHPEDPRFPANLASALERLNDLAGAEAAAAEALALAPGDASLLYLQATLDHRLGRLEAARDRLEDMLSKDPPQEYRGEALCELGEVLDKLGESAAAFRAIAEGNALRARSPAARAADGGRFLARVAAAREGFTEERIQAMAAQAPASAGAPPIFFVGFPRSGTTLVERALKAHPEVVTTDERSPLAPILTELSKNKAYPQNLDRLTGEDIKQL